MTILKFLWGGWVIPLLTLLGFGDTVTFSCGVCCADRHKTDSNIYNWCWLLAVGWSTSIPYRVVQVSIPRD